MGIQQSRTGFGFSAAGQFIAWLPCD